jgi:hypothetical protein
VEGIGKNIQDIGKSVQTVDSKVQGLVVDDKVQDISDSVGGLDSKMTLIIVRNSYLCTAVPAPSSTSELLGGRERKATTQQTATDKVKHWLPLNTTTNTHKWLRNTHR